MQSTEVKLSAGENSLYYIAFGMAVSHSFQQKLNFTFLFIYQAIVEKNCTSEKLINTIYIHLLHKGNIIP